MNVEEIYRFNFVTDPDDPNVSSFHNRFVELTNMITTSNINEYNLDRGLVRYDIDLIYDHNDDPDHINELIKIIGNMSYVPVTTTMNISDYTDKNIEGSIITGAANIVKSLTEKILKTEIINVETSLVSIGEDNKIITFNPITNYQTSAYENPMYMSEYNNIVNMDILRGYQVLSEDPMVRYVLEDLYDSKEYVPSDVNVIYVEGVSLVPVGNNINEEKHYNNIIDRVFLGLRKRRSDGYFVYNISIHDLEDLELIHELSKLWETELIYDDDMVNIVLQTDLDFGVRPEIWFRNNLTLIKNGYFPSVTLYGDWQFQSDDYNQLFGKEFYDSMLHYGALLAYKKMGTRDKFIRPFTHTVTINNDLSITISVPTYKHGEIFKQYFQEILKGYRGLEHNGSETWMAHSCKDLIDGIVKRWHVQTIDDKAMPMILYHINEDGTKGEVLVFRSPVMGLYRSDHPFNFNDMEGVKEDLIINLRKYYRECNNGETISGKKIYQMGLEDLLNLVEIRERPDHPTYCTNRENIIKNEESFQDNTTTKAMLMDWGWRGLFDVGPLKGLYRDTPEKILIQPKVGHPTFHKLVLSVPSAPSEGERNIEIEINFEDDTVSPLFDIVTNDQAKLEKIVKELWHQGYFLSYWTSAVQKYGKNVKSYSVIITDPLLLNAGNSKSEGNEAMKYLENICGIQLQTSD